MSTKTTFKRIALVAVAALGLGVLSVAPSSAAVTALTVTPTTGATATALSSTTVSADSTTAAFVTVSGLLSSNTDTIAVTFFAKSAPATSTVAAHLTYVDTASSTTADVQKSAGSAAARLSASESKTATNSFIIVNSAAGYAGGTFYIQLDSATATAAYGTYTYTVVATPYNGGVAGTAVSADSSITVAAYADLSKTTSATKSFAKLTATSATPDSTTVDSVVSAVSSVGTVAGYVYVGLRNSANASAAVESVTATLTGAGVICTAAGVCGKSFKLDQTGDVQLTVKGDGTAGVATINVSTPSVTFDAKTVTFYAKAAKTITASVYNPVLVVGANTSAIAVKAVDANGTSWGGDAYIYASTAADALIGGSATTPVKCSTALLASTGYIFCPITTIAAGTAKFKVIDTAAIADATATSNEVTVTVSADPAATVKLAFDKASYAPFEKAIITVTPLTSKGSALGGKSYTGLLASGGISANTAFSGSSDTLTATDITTSAYSSATSSLVAGAKTYVVYMPAASGNVTITATGGTALSLAGQVAVSATASVVNSSVDAATDAANEATDAANAATDAALAAADAADAATAAAQDASDAVAALSATVDKLVASLKAQITSLTNLVIKIQKKVKA